MINDAQQDWVERARQGEPAAIAELYRRYWHAARAAAYGVTADLTLAEDAASEAFFATLDGLRGLKDTQRFGPWLRTIVIRTAERRKTTMSRDRSLGAEVLHDDPSETPSTHLERRELATLIHEAVGNLTADLREAISLFYFEGYSLCDAADFLDVPEGTLKRRLHDGRQRLRKAAERILRGRKPMNQPREQILEQLKSAFDQDPNSDAFYQALRKALRLRPFPDGLLREAVQKHWGPKLEKASKDPDRSRTMSDALSQIYSTSERASDPNHPVGAIAREIRAALPEFQPWQPDMSQVDYTQVARRMSEGKALSMPPNFAEESSASYVTAMRAWLVQDRDGSVCTTSELMQRKATLEELQKQMSQVDQITQ